MQYGGRRIMPGEGVVSCARELTSHMPDICIHRKSSESNAILVGAKKKLYGTRKLKIDNTRKIYRSFRKMEKFYKKARPVKFVVIMKQRR